MLEDKIPNESDQKNKELDLIFENKILKHKVDLTEGRNKVILTVGAIVFLGLGIFSYTQLDSKLDTAITKLNSKSEGLEKQINDDRNTMNDWFNKKEIELNKIIQFAQKADVSCLIENRHLINQEVSFNSPNETKYLIIQNTGSKVIERARVHLYTQDKVLTSLKPDHQWQPIIPSDKENHSQYFYNLEERLYSLIFLSPNEKTSLPLKFITGVSQSSQTVDAILVIYYENDSKIIPFKLKFGR